MSLSGTNNIMTFEPFSTSERSGAIVVFVFALLSALALVFVILRTIRLAMMAFLRSGRCTSRPPEILFFRTQLGHYSGCLILSNLFISATGLTNLSWVSNSGLIQGSACSAQAVLRQIGIWGTCWFTAALGVDTFASFVFHTRPSRWRSLVTGIIGWLIALVAALAPLHRSDVYGPAGPSCGVARSYPKDIFIFALEALPVILTVFVSVVVCPVTLIVLRRRHSMQELRCSNSNHQQDVQFAEYHGFVCTIICTLFWFPFAFALLLLPFCITHILMFAGQSIPPASDVFADVCVSLLGFVNVCLLYNTLRVIGLAYSGRSAKLIMDTMKTFGNDASGESPIVLPFFSQPPWIWPDEKNSLVSNPIPSALSHSRDSSWASVNSNAELFSKEKAAYETVQTTLASQASSFITSPLWSISRQFDSDTPLRSSSFETRTPYVSPVTRPEFLTQDQRRELTFKFRAPPALDLPPFPPLSVQKVTNKSSSLAPRLGVPSHKSAGRSAEKFHEENERASVFPATEHFRIEADLRSTGHTDESNSPPSSPSSYSDSDSDYSGEIRHAYKVRPLSPVPELNDDEQEVDCPPSPSMRTRSERFTMTTVWSQETGYTFSQPNTVAREMLPQTVVNLLPIGVIPADKADAGEVVSRSTPSGPRAHPTKTRRPLKVASKLSARVSEMLGPKTANSMGFEIVFVPHNDSDVV